MTKSIILATGAHSIELPGMEIRWGENIELPNRQSCKTRLPKSVVIIGGGAIGVEFATIWNGIRCGSDRCRNEKTTWFPMKIPRLV
jgi:dihydrolipoamide dehydrogenase